MSQFWDMGSHSYKGVPTQKLGCPILRSLTAKGGNASHFLSHKLSPFLSRLPTPLVSHPHLAPTLKTPSKTSVKPQFRLTSTKKTQIEIAI